MIEESSKYICATLRYVILFILKNKEALFFYVFTSELENELFKTNRIFQCFSPIVKIIEYKVGKQTGINSKL